MAVAPTALPPGLKPFEGIARVPLDLIDVLPEKYQYRKGSMAGQKGLDSQHVQNILEAFDPNKFEPIWTRAMPSGRYELLGGHHRLEVFKAARDRGGFPNLPTYDVKTIPALIRTVTDDEALNLARLSNASVKQYKPSELAAVFRAESDRGLSFDAIGKTYGNRKASEVEKYIFITYLPENLQGILDQQQVVSKAFNVDHAAVLGAWLVKYKRDPNEASTIFQEVLSQAEYTPNQLQKMLDNMTPTLEESEQGMFEGFSGLSRGGVLSAMRAAMEEIRTEELARRRLNGFLKLIAERRKTGQAIPMEFEAALTAAEADLGAIAQRIDAIRERLGREVKRGGRGQAPESEPELVPFVPPKEQVALLAADPGAAPPPCPGVSRRLSLALPT